MSRTRNLELAERAVELLRQPGASVRGVAGQLGVARSTVADWKRLYLAEGPAAPSPAYVDPPLDPEPQYTDRHFMHAYARYVSLLSNGVSHHRALEAVQRVDPDFDLDQEAAFAILEALGKTDEPIKLSEELRFGPTPPPHVLDVYDAHEFSAEAVDELAAELYSLNQAAYLAAVNEQLARLGLSNITAIRDQGILDYLRENAAEVARGIASTHNSALAAHLYATYIEHHATLGRQSSRTLLDDEAVDWEVARAEWKAEQIAVSQTGTIFNWGVNTFRQRNPDLRGETGRVVPLGGQCDACEAASMLGTQPAHIILELDIPLHVGCVHSVEWDYSPEDGALDNVWTGGAEEEAA